MARPRKLTDAERLENKLKSQNSEVNKQRRRENSIIYYYKKKLRLLEEKEKENLTSTNQPVLPLQV